MTQYVDVPYLLRQAEALPRDPAVDDLGPLFAAVARHQAAALETEVYGSDHLKAAALLHTLARLECLEHSNAVFAFAAAEAFLAVNDHQLTYDPKAAAELTERATAGQAGVQQLALALRRWTT